MTAIATHKIALTRRNRLVIRRPDGSVTVYLVDDDTGEPLAYIPLVVRYADGREDTFRTDDDGRVRISVKPGVDCFLERVEDVFEIVSVS